MLSGKFVLRLAPEFHRALKDEARRNGESLNSLCLRKLQSVPSSSLQGDVISQITDEFKPLGIVLFGSMARGDATTKSDIDLLIILPEEIPISRALYQRWDQRIKNADRYSPQFVHLPKTGEAIGSLWLEVALDGDILFAGDGRIKNSLLRIRSQIAEGKYLRKISHGHAYWVRREEDAK